MKKKAVKLIEYVILIAIPLGVYLFFSEDASREVVRDQKELIVPEVHAVADADRSDRIVAFDEKVFPLIEKVISEAKESIAVSTYTVSQNRIMDLLEEKSGKGVKVSISYGKSKDGYVPSFSRGPVLKKYGLFHSKFIVTDSQNVLVLSANIGSDSRAINNAVLFRNAPKASEILREEVRDASEGKLPKRCAEGCDTEIGRIFFTPGKACVNIKKELLKAHSGVDGEVYTVTTKNPVITGLKNVLKKKRIPVRLVFDNWKGDGGKVVNAKAARYFTSLGADVRFDNKIFGKDPLFHHNFFVIDEETVILGSLNWTSSGCYRNREIVVINKDRKISEKFSEYFSSIWKD